MSGAVNTGLLSSQDSEAPIYGWYDNGTLYYYTDASTIYLNSDSSYMFDANVSLESIDTTNWDTSNVTNMEYMFELCGSLT